MTGPSEHPDLTAEIGQRLGQGLAVLATLAEAGARLAAEEIRRRERAADLTRDLDTRTRAAAEHARLLAERATAAAARRDRIVIAQVLEPGWTDKADLLDLARVWRTARAREHQPGFPGARAAAEEVEARLRQLYLRPMDLYDQAVARGVPRHAAMAAAAAAMATTPVTRPHGRTEHPALPAGAEPVGDRAFTTALAAERHTLATGAPAGPYAEQLAALHDLEPAAADALRALITTGPRTGHTTGQPTAPTDRPETDDPTPAPAPPVGPNPDADQDPAAPDRPEAVQVAVQWYPHGLGPTAPPGLAGKRPAQTRPPTPAPTEGARRHRGRTR